MKNKWMRKIAMFVCLFLVGNAVYGVNDKPFVVPEITQWQGSEGDMNLSGRVVVKSATLQVMAQKFCQDYLLLTGRHLQLISGNQVKDGDIVFLMKKGKNLGIEGYRMSIGRYCEVTAATPKAIYWAMQTLLQLSEQKECLPCGEAVDIPQYRIRGFMLDVARKYIPLDYVRKLVRIMSYYKMNTLQLHLNDNGFKQYFGDDWTKTYSAFRLECDTYPGLTAKDGSYTKQEFRELTEMAATHGIDIIPEIDAPAHVLAFTQYQPSLASEKYGMDHFDIFNPEVYTFMDNLFKEYLSGKNPVFAGKYVHIGTDEYSNATQELKEKFRAYTDHYLALVQSYGKHPLLWGALTHADGKTPVRQKGVTMSIWSNDMANPLEMKKQGWRFISIPDWQVYLVPLADYYHDYLPLKSLYEAWTPRILRSVELQELDPQIEGGMFALWNDLYGNGITVADLHDRIFPVLQIIADKTWTAQLVKTPFEKYQEGKAQLSEAPGINEQGKMSDKSLEIVQLKANEKVELPVSQVGFGHRISFTIHCQPEQKGTVLFYGPQSTFFLSDPVSGKMGYQRENYLDTFDLALPEEGDVDIAIETTHTSTILYVNGQKREQLDMQRFYVVDKQDRVSKMVNTPGQPILWNPSTSMRYSRTLFFPLQKTGDFKSKVSNLKIKSIIQDKDISLTK